MHVDGDGRFRAVVADRDPGVPNWLDTEGHPDGLVSYRWVWSATAPAPEAAVVRLDELAPHLPVDHPRLDADDRARRQAERRAHIERRFQR